MSGGLAGEVVLPRYIADTHAYVLAKSEVDDVGAYSGTEETLTFSVVSIAQSIMTSSVNPYALFTYSNPSTHFGEAETQWDTYYSHATAYAVDAYVDAASYAIEALTVPSTYLADIARDEIILWPITKEDDLVFSGVTQEADVDQSLLLTEADVSLSAPTEEADITVSVITQEAALTLSAITKEADISLSAPAQAADVSVSVPTTGDITLVLASTATTDAIGALALIAPQVLSSATSALNDILSEVLTNASTMTDGAYTLVKADIQALLTDAYTTSLAGASVAISTTTWDTIVTKAKAELDDSNIPPEIAIEDIVFTAARNAQEHVYEALASARAAIDNGAIEEIVSQFDKRQGISRARQMSQFRAQMADINAVNSSAFLFGMALLQAEQMRETADFNAQMTVEMLRQGVETYLRTFMGEMQTYLQAEVADKANYTQILNASTEIMTQFTLQGTLRAADIMQLYVSLFNAELQAFVAMARGGQDLSAALHGLLGNGTFGTYQALLVDEARRAGLTVDVDRFNREINNDYALRKAALEVQAAIANKQINQGYFLSASNISFSIAEANKQLNQGYYLQKATLETDLAVRDKQINQGYYLQKTEYDLTAAMENARIGQGYYLRKSELQLGVDQFNKEQNQLFYIREAELNQRGDIVNKQLNQDYWIRLAAYRLETDRINKEVNQSYELQKAAMDLDASRTNVTLKLDADRTNRMAREGRYQTALAHTTAMMQNKVEFERAAAALFTEQKRIRIVGLVEHEAAELDKDMRETLWNMDVAHMVGQFISMPLTGAAPIGKQPSRLASVLGGALQFAAGALSVLASAGVFGGGDGGRQNPQPTPWTVTPGGGINPGSPPALGPSGPGFQVPGIRL